jgi:peptidoglycan/LPS O-acetylase OafA/YrhL
LTSPELAAAEQQRSVGVDLLRGICVLLVTLHHIHLRFKLNKFPVAQLLPEPVARVLFWSGYFAVITFFVISGFLITSMSLRRWSSLDRIRLSQFYWLRFARIVPCLVLLVLVLSVLHLAQATGFVIPAERVSLGRAVLAALTFHLNWLEGRYGYLPGGWDVLWSLSVEEVFYLSFPALCLLLRSRSARGAGSVRWLLVPLLALIVIGPFQRVALGGRVPWQEYAYLACMDGIAWGCLAALLSARLQLGQRVLRLLLALGSAAIALVVVFRNLALNRLLQGVGLEISVLELGVALLLIALAQGVGRTLLARGTGWLRLVGRCSYEIYLTHMLVILGLMPLIVARQPPTSWLLAWYLLLLTASIALGWIVHAVYSEPLNRALRSRYPAVPC